MQHNGWGGHFPDLQKVLIAKLAEATDWSYYHRMDEQFHQLVGTASCLDSAVEVYHETLAGLYDYFIPYPIEKLHKSNQDHVALVAALRAGDVQDAVEVARKHVDILHRTMFMGLAQGEPSATISD